MSLGGGTNIVHLTMSATATASASSATADDAEVEENTIAITGGGGADTVDLDLSATARATGDRQARVTHQMPGPRSCDGTIGDAGLRDPARRAIDMMREDGIGTEIDRVEDVAAAVEAHPVRMRAGLSLGIWPAAVVLGHRRAARRKPRRRIERP